jgi:3-deoxy-D-manno-octulosonate 8-phosphate phosphatase KdsC-like HAD superfamily phosphatase
MAINPIQQPINYAVEVQSPFEAAISGVKIGAGLEELEVARQKRAMEAQQLQAAQAQQAQFRSSLNSFFAKPAAERTFEELQPLLVGANKQQFDALKLVGENMSKERLDSSKRFTSQVLLAFEANPETAKTLIQERINAETDPGQKRAFQDILTIANQDPNQAARLVESLGAGTFGEDWYKGITAVRAERRTAAREPEELKRIAADANTAVTNSQLKVQELRAKLEAEPDVAIQRQLKTELDQAQVEEKKALASKAAADALVAEGTVVTRIGKAASEAETAAVNARFAEQLAQAGLNKTNWDIKNLQSQINDRAAKLNLDRQTTAATVAEKMASIQARLTDIPEGARKLINESATLASTSKQAATQYNDLAKRIEAAEGGKGALTSATEWLAKATGSQDAWTQIRNEYTRVRNSVAIKSLPPGVATDKDIELALKGIPPENANAATLASFLRGSAKLQDIDSAINNAKTDWLSQNNGLLTRAKSTFIAGDYAAKPGETFNDFAQRIVGDVSQKYRSPAQVAEERRQQAVAQIPTTAAPAAAPAAASAATPASVMSQADAILRGGR